MNRRFLAVMFDLDGTLLDTLEDIAAAGNHALTSVHRPTYPLAAYRYLAGQGAPWLIETALGPEHQHLAAPALQAFKAYQLRHGLDRTQPYPGVPDMLDAMVARGLRLAILSNKPDAATQEAARLRLSRWKFDAVRGHRAGGPLKPDPAGALQIAEELRIAPEHWLYLGDTKVDIATARAAGMYAVGVLWGFRDETELRQAGAEAIVAHPRDVLPLLET